MQAVVDWLSFVPKTFSDITTPPIKSSDSITRDIDFIPSKTPYDPRHMLGWYIYMKSISVHFAYVSTYLGGTISSLDGSYISGFLDKNSFKEYLGGWGKSVVVGRGRLGGINVGVIAVETRTVEQRIPADPGLTTIGLYLTT